MRLARQSRTTIYAKKMVTTKDDEGNVIKDWGDPIPMTVDVQPAGGQVNASIYGKELAYVKSIMYQGTDIQEGRDEDTGLFLYASTDAEPDYEIESISTYHDHITILAKKVRTDG
ncbi:hypothetical protein [Levilactobacillus brevis]|uniref:hypothetical protein n=1 Tax=Levilactobacillus brevis TaxID=1580 RepID=UPI000A202FB9|nr:hypothetical protein [Levilactobacillus brevis]ARN92887.1 hypothetical protein AZI11_08230 [Levilactobacillus brevis]ARN95531.1 hypothetical protein AZI12_08280 [Levilactobacillus brevis]MBS0978676.1 hypothetical protein [Levilactobacillus brevis]